jgi:hypothetical protein
MPVGRKVVAPFAVRVNQVEAHIFYGVLRRGRWVVGLNCNVIASIDSERLRGVKGAEIKRRRTGRLYCRHFCLPLDRW